MLDRRLIQATAYVVESKEIDQSGFIAMLQQRAIEVRRKTLKVRADGSMKGDWDMEMALDILDMAPEARRRRAGLGRRRLHVARPSREDDGAEGRGRRVSAQHREVAPRGGGSVPRLSTGAR